MHVVQLRPGREPILLADELAQLALGEAKFRAGADHLALRFEERLGPLRLQHVPVADLGPQRQHLLGLERLAVGAGASGDLGHVFPARLHPGLEHHALMLERALAQLGPAAHDVAIPAFDVPQIGQAGAVDHAREGLVQVAVAEHPLPRIADALEHAFGRGTAVDRLSQLAGQLGREFGGGRPELHHRLPRLRQVGRRGEAGGGRHAGAEHRLHALDHRPGHILLRLEHGLALRRPEIGERLEALAAIRAHCGNSITWRTALPSCRRSKPSLMSSSLSLPLISRSTGSLPARYSATKRGMSRVGTQVPM